MTRLEVYYTTSCLDGRCDLAGSVSAGQLLY